MFRWFDVLLQILDSRKLRKFVIILKDALYKVQDSPVCKLPELSLELPRLVRWQKTKEDFPWMASMGLSLAEHLFQVYLAV